jgi:hypothetical protein
MAFSLKPRVGLTFDETRKITLDVLDAGFNIVELDAGTLPCGPQTLINGLASGRKQRELVSM